MNRIALSIIVALAASGVCFAQSNYKDLTPGKSTRSDVDRVLGQPVKQISQTLFEYRPNQPTQSKIYFQYRKDSAIVERIEILLVKPRTRADILTVLHLPQQPTASRVNSRGVLEEYFGSSFYVVLTYEGAEASSGVARTGRYSRELFDSAIASAPRPAQNSATQSSSSGNSAGSLTLTNSDLPDYMRPPAGASSATLSRAGQTSGSDSCFASAPAIANTTRSVHYDWATQQSTGVLDEHLKNKLGLLFRCSSRTDDQLARAFADISVYVAKYVPNVNCFNGDGGVISTDASSHYNWARTKSRAEMLTNLQAKVSSALRCLDRNAKNGFYADVSVAVARSGT